MNIEIGGTLGIVTNEQAAEYMATHVIISKADLARVRELAERLGFLDELKALDVEVQELTLGSL